MRLWLPRLGVQADPAEADRRARRLTIHLRTLTITSTSALLTSAGSAVRCGTLVAGLGGLRSCRSEGGAQPLAQQVLRAPEVLVTFIAATVFVVPTTFSTTLLLLPLAPFFTSTAQVSVFAVVACFYTIITAVALFSTTLVFTIFPIVFVLVIIDFYFILFFTFFAIIGLFT